MVTPQEELHNLKHLSYQIQDCTWPFTAIATALFLLSTVARIWMHKGESSWRHVSLEYAIIAFSWVMDVIRGAFLQKGLYLIRQIQLDDLERTVPPATFWINVADSWTCISIVLPKFGVALLLMRIFRPQPLTKCIMMGLCLLLLAINIVAFVITWTQCKPVQFMWDPYQHPDGHCWPIQVSMIYSIVDAAYSGLMDLGFSIYPGVVIWNLKMDKWKRLSTMALMSLGVCCFAFAIVKLVGFADLLSVKTIYGRLWQTTYIAIWSGIENDFVIITACLPSVPPFFRLCTSRFRHYHSTVSSKISRLSSNMTSRSDPKELLDDERM